MSQDTRTRPPEPGARESLDGLDGGPSVDASDVLNRLWRFFISMRTGLMLILALGLLSLAGTLLAQAPAGMAADPQAYASWLTSVKPKYGGWTTVFDKLGFFSMFTSIWFKGITVLLATSVLACSVNRAPRLWKLAFHPRTRMSGTFFTHAPLRAGILVDAAPDKALEDVRDVLKSHHFRTVSDPDDGGLNLYADRFRWGPFGTVMAHLSFVIILLGFFLSATTGFKDTQFTAPVGQKVEVGHGTGLTVEARSFADTYYPDGSPADYVSDLVVYKDGVQVKRQMVRVNQPLAMDGVSFYQSFFGVAASMKVTDTAGKTLYGAAVPLAWTSDDGTHSIGQFDMKAQGLSVYVIGAASGKPDPNIKAGQMQLEIHQDGKNEPIATQVVDQGKSATIAGVNYTFERTRPFTGLIVADDPGAIWVWIGSTLLVLGLFLVFFFPHRRVWARIRKTSTGSEILCASTMKRDVAFKPQFHQLVTDIQLAGTPSRTTQEAGQNHA
ncbi:MAG TPA: cytochrome c biogenesis protein ResB [Dermatophilaceae bacterium]|nr:cytochrome c biogenesis protein ResB [Dermatophilaceae bacterium]